MARSDWMLDAFAKLLPKEFRERVFEPALADIRLEEQQAAAPRRTSRLAKVILVAECMRLALPQLLWRRGRPTRLAAAMFVAIAVVSLLVLRRNYVSWPPAQ